MTLEFQAWPKIPRWSNETVTITEKIDGTNAAVIILPYSEEHEELIASGYAQSIFNSDENRLTFATQSRKRFIKPGKDTDNAGFASWAWGNDLELVQALGYGKHYGEWWGRGIQRSYDMNTKMFSLFSPWRYDDGERDFGVDNLSVVPVIFKGAASNAATESSLNYLRDNGSLAAPGYMRPEGIIIQSALARSTYKAFVDDDGIPKSLKEGN